MVVDAHVHTGKSTRLQVSAGVGLLIYALAIFAGAFLLFIVQPILAKIILPWFGGAAGVWTASMLFFQAVLLLGYLYACWTVRCLQPKAQALLHLALLGASVLVLPVRPDASWQPTGNEEPVFRILGLLGACVGLPYFLLSATGPLLQAWYARSYRVAFPYRFFALSNLGCLLALLAYPVIIEPFVTTRWQVRTWSWAYVGFLVLCSAAALVYRASGSRQGEVAEQADRGGPPRLGWKRPVLWVALAACGSTLLLAVTSHLSQNVAPVPLLWIAPLSVYLLSFVLCFDREGWYRLGLFRWLLPVVLVSLCLGLFRGDWAMSLKLGIPLFVVGLFVCCMFCHGELARTKPSSEQLTSFYLMVALGGALGGLFTSVVATRLLPGPFELQIGIAACAMLALVRLYGYSSPKHLIVLGLLMLLAFVGTVKFRASASGIRVMVRNFYGSLWVKDSDGGDGEEAARVLYHGPIIHGAQFLSAARAREATTYYGLQSGVGLALQHRRRPNQRIGVIGLGVGTLATYGRPGDYFRFYEINPLVVQLAGSQFWFLRDSEARCEVVLSDARVALEREPAQQFDVLVVDAFSGDSIPVHLMTRQAFELYFRHLKQDGVLAVHISNLYVDLAPLLRKMAAVLGKQARLIQNWSDPQQQILTATWMLMSTEANSLPEPPLEAALSRPEKRSDPRLWTDDYSNLLAVLK
jgi:spermidine synthase